MSTPEITHLIRLVDAPKAKNIPFDIHFSTDELAVISDILSAQSVKKMRIAGTITPSAANDWILKANVGATVIQLCVVSFNPVQTRVDTAITRTFLADYSFHEEETVTEMPSDETIDPLSDEIDLTSIAIEAIALALPDYPRAPGAKLETSVFTAPGIAPMQDADTKPFASLASLKDKLTNEDK